MTYQSDRPGTRKTNEQEPTAAAEPPLGFPINNRLEVLPPAPLRVTRPEIRLAVAKYILELKNRIKQPMDGGWRPVGRRYGRPFRTFQIFSDGLRTLQDLAGTLVTEGAAIPLPCRRPVR